MAVRRSKCGKCRMDMTRIKAKRRFQKSHKVKDKVIQATDCFNGRVFMWAGRQSQVRSVLLSEAPQTQSVFALFKGLAIKETFPHQ